jgi:YesN/AraC family two-component response regulator
MKPRILFVDDDEFVIKGLEILLFKQRGTWDMHFVSSGKQALDLFHDNPFDLVVSDVRMPGLDGIQLVKRLKEEAPNTICILLSGDIEEHPLMSLIEDGIVHSLISKPCSYQALYDILTQCVNHIIEAKQDTPSRPTGLQEE